jgi:anti-sigma B factor antagonist
MKQPSDEGLQDDLPAPRPKPLTIHVNEKHGVAIVTPQGTIDYEHLTDFKERLAAVADAGCMNVVVDLSHARYIASTTIGILISHKARVVKAKGDLRLAKLSPGLWKIFGLLGVESIFQHYDCVDEAVQSFRK